jgi:endonuclease/exonuclease/phosphatase family metal-dependent hydrolase
LIFKIPPLFSEAVFLCRGGAKVFSTFHSLCRLDVVLSKKNLLRCFSVTVALAGLSACERGRTESAHQVAPVESNAELPLRLMTFNVRYENREDFGSRAWPKRVRGIVSMLHRVNPDVFGVQEALHGQAADIRASLPEYDFDGVGRDDGKSGGEYSAIFFRRDRFKPDPADGGTFWLSDTPESPGSATWGNEIPRVAAWRRLVDQATGRGFYVFNTHWDHRHDGSRQQAALLIAKRIDSRAYPGEPVVLIGDFNSLEASPGLGFITGRQVPIAGANRRWANGLIDTFQVLHRQQRNRRTLHFWKNSTEGNLKVDHILVSQGAGIRASEIVSQDNPMVSDHFPVTAEVVFPPQ